MRDDRAGELEALLDDVACLSPELCLLRVKARWALSMPDGASYRAKVAQLQPRIDKLMAGMGDLAALADDASTTGREYAAAYTARMAIAAEAPDPVTSELLRRTALDQFVQFSFEPIFLGDDLTQEDFERLSEIHRELVSLEFRSNAIWLDDVVAERGWFTNSRDGEAAATGAFLIVQHADHDPEWQSSMLASHIEPLVRSGEIDARQYAFLFDRVAVNSGALQRYGTQGRVRRGEIEVGTCRWELQPVEPPKEELDARRAAMGLGPEAEYVAQFCPPS
jgi:hypothetical protein